VTVERGVFALGDLDHQPNRLEVHELTRMGKLALSKTSSAHAVAEKIKPAKQSDSVVVRLAGLMQFFLRLGLTPTLYSLAHFVGFNS
jgi:hypothetical protein